MQQQPETQAETVHAVQDGPSDPERRPLSAAANRALAEAEERRRAREGEPALPPEINGRKGAEPVRFGDWEKNGIAVDF